MGGKYSHLNYLLPLLPQTKVYVEPFAGSAAALLNREPSSMEIYNDLNSDIVNFFRVLRDNKQELIRRLELTPFSREEFGEAIESDFGDDGVEKARKFFIKMLQSRLNKVTGNLSIGRWNFSINPERRQTAGVSRYTNKIKMLDVIAKRLLQVQIEHYPALKVIELYDSPDTLFYCDPPYPLGTRSHHKIYKHEMSDFDHRKLAEKLRNVNGLVALSSYDCDMINELYAGWQVYKEKAKLSNLNRLKLRQECLYTNYDIHELQGQMSFAL